MSSLQNLTALRAQISAILKVLDQAEQARLRPDLRYKRLGSLPQPYQMTDGDRAAWMSLRERFAAEEREQAQIASQRERRRLAVELDGLRDRLPHLATEARFELLDVVTELRA